MASAVLISVAALLSQALSMSWTSRTRISSLMRGPSLAAGCGVLIGRRMVLISFYRCDKPPALHDPFGIGRMLSGEY
jgi:hypothetical protein